MNKIPNDSGHDAEFTRREIEVLKLASEGLLNKEIADNLGIEECTIKRHRQNIMRRLNIKGRAAFMRFLMKFKG